MQKWQYRRIRIGFGEVWSKATAVPGQILYKSEENLLGQLDELGSDGWELVNVVVLNNNTEWFYFKRPEQ